MTEREEEEMIVTPWEVRGEIDYDKLIEQFGVQPMTNKISIISFILIPFRTVHGILSLRLIIVSFLITRYLKIKRYLISSRMQL